MDPEAARHRTFGDPWDGHPPIWIGPQQMAAEKGVHVAYTVRDKHLVQILIQEKKDQDFWLYATAWELEWSKLVFTSNPVMPLVDDKMMVVGYYDWINEDNIFVPSTSTGGLDDMLKNGDDVLVARRSPGPTYRSMGMSERNHLLLIDIHGCVRLRNGFKHGGYLERESITPYDFWIGIKLVVSLTGSLRGKIVATLASKFGKSAALAGVFRDLTEAELEELGATGSPKVTLVVGRGRGANTPRSTVPDVGIPETLAHPSVNPDYATLLQDAPQKFPHLRGRYWDIFIERIGINPSAKGVVGLTPDGVKAARDFLRPKGTLRILQNPLYGQTFEQLEKDIRSMLSDDFTITKVERHPDGLLVTAKKK